jgi:hypothetical protein
MSLHWRISPHTLHGFSTLLCYYPSVSTLFFFLLCPSILIHKAAHKLTVVPAVTLCPIENYSTRTLKIPSLERVLAFGLILGQPTPGCKSVAGAEKGFFFI